MNTKFLLVNQGNTKGIVLLDAFFGFQSDDGIAMVAVGNLHFGLYRSEYFGGLWVPFVILI